MVFRYTIRPVIPDAQRWAGLLCGRADDRALRLSRMRGRSLARSMTGELLCRELLAELQPGESLCLSEDASGKPFLHNSSLYVSISHSGEFAAAAAADVPVGIDLQESRRISDSVLRRCFSPEEQSWVQTGNATERAIRLWTMKEAYGKLKGTGIFRGDLFHAGFDGDALVTRYEDLSFLFPEALEGFFFTACLAAQKEED